MHSPRPVSAMGAALIGALALLGGTTWAAASAWQLPANQLSTSGNISGDSDVASHAPGQAVAVWKASDGTNEFIQAARYQGGAWGPATTISTPWVGAFRPQVVVDSSGVATAVWEQSSAGVNTQVWTARLEGGAWSLPESLSNGTDDADRPQVAVDSSGVVTAVWSLDDGTDAVIQARRFANGTWGTTDDISAVNGDASTPQVVADSTGTVTVAWSRFDNTAAERRVQARRLAGGTWGAVQDLSATGGVATDPVLAVDGADGVAAAWVRDPAAGSRTVQALRYSGGAWGGTANDLSDTRFDAYGPSIAADASGNVTVAWDEFQGSYIAYAARYAGGTWGVATQLSAAGEIGRQAEVAADPSGAVTAIWAGSPDGLQWTAQAARFTGGAWSGPSAISPVGMAHNTPSNVVVDPSGVATATWTWTDGSAGFFVQAARFVFAPGTPGSVTATAGNGSAQVSWAAPSSDGGAPIASYTATASPGGASCTVQAPATACSVDGLANGTAYSFAVSATGPGGTSVLSAPSAPVTPSAPAAGPEQPAAVPAAPVTPAAPTARIPKLAGTFTLNRPTRVATTSGRVPAGVTRIVQGARAPKTRTTRAKRATGKCRITKRTYRCTITLTKGTWTVTTTARGKAGVVAKGVRKVRVR